MDEDPKKKKKSRANRKKKTDDEPRFNASNSNNNLINVRFVLTMDDVVVNGQKIDQIVFEWEAKVEQSAILEVSHQWITTQNFLTKRMVGLTRVGKSSLTIEPMD